MSTERDPQLMALFAEAETELDDPGFRHELMQSIGRERRKTLIVWTAFVAVALVCVALFAAPFVAAAKMATALLPSSLVSIEADWRCLNSRLLGSATTSYFVSVMRMCQHHRQPGVIDDLRQAFLRIFSIQRHVCLACLQHT